MRWRCGAGRSSTRGWPRLRVTGRAFAAMAFWLLAVPLKWVTAAAGAALIHELGHLTALWLLDRRVWAVELDAFGAEIETEPLTPREELVCALAGPAAGALVCLFWRLAPALAVCAGAQTAFNLLPVFPLDGGRALRAVRNICCKDAGFGVQ